MKLIKTVGEIVIERANEAAKAALKEYASAIRPIYASTSQGRPEPIGSCILVNITGTPIFLTAAHVIDESNHASLYIGGESSLVPINGDFLSTDNPQKDRRKDRYDFAAWKLPQQVTTELGHVKYIGEHEFDINSDRPEGYLYLVIGYPITKNRNIDPVSKSVKTQYWSYYSTVKNDTALKEKLGITGHEHILIGFNKKHSLDSAGRIINSISPRGVSGGALVNLGNVAHPKYSGGTVDCKPLLAGLYIEFHKSHGTFVSTKIQTVVRALKRGKEKGSG